MSSITATEIMSIWRECMRENIHSYNEKVVYYGKNSSERNILLCLPSLILVVILGYDLQSKLLTFLLSFPLVYLYAYHFSVSNCDIIPFGLARFEYSIAGYLAAVQGKGMISEEALVGEEMWKKIEQKFRPLLEGEKTFADKLKYNREFLETLYQEFIRL